MRRAAACCSGHRRAPRCEPAPRCHPVAPRAMRPRLSARVCAPSRARANTGCRQRMPRARPRLRPHRKPQLRQAHHHGAAAERRPRADRHSLLG
eukprot:2467772-Prymnesium_polylepis.1